MANWRALSGALALLLMGVDVRAERLLAPLPVEQLLSAPSIAYQLSFSPDGRKLAFVLQDSRRIAGDRDPRFQMVRRSGISFTDEGSDVWIVDRNTRTQTNLTEGRGSSWAPSWSPDGKQLAFFSDRSGIATLWAWEPQTGRTRQVVTGTSFIVRPFGTGLVAQWTSDSREVVLSALPDGVSVERFVSGWTASPQEVVVPSTTTTVKVFRSAGAHPAGEGDTTVETAAGIVSADGWRNVDIAVANVATGKVRFIVRARRPTGVALSPDGRTVAYGDYRKTGNDGQEYFDLVIVPIGGGESRRVGADVPLQFGNAFSWSPDGQWIAYVENGGKAASQAMVFQSADGKRTRRSSTSGMSEMTNIVIAPRWASNSRSAFVLANHRLWRGSISGGPATGFGLDGLQGIALLAPVMGGDYLSSDRGRSLFVLGRNPENYEQSILRIDARSGQLISLLRQPVRYGIRFPHLSFATNNSSGSIAFIREDGAHAPEIWVTDKGFDSAERLASVSPVFDRYVMGESRLISWLSPGGLTRHGSVLLPAGYEPGRRYPTVIYQYPGENRAQDVHAFGLNPHDSPVDNLQAFATRGYAVFIPDIPLDDEAPRMLSIGAEIDLAVNRIIELGIADPERIGIAGHSYGGYGVMAAIVQSRRFRAAVSRAGAANLITTYGALSADGTAFGVTWSQGQGGMTGTPWQNLRQYIDNSPWFFLDKLQTPVLLIQGGSDRAVQPIASDEIFVALRALGKKVEYARYDGEDHYESLWSYANQVDFLTRTIDWFDRYLALREGVFSRE